MSKKPTNIAASIRDRLLNLSRKRKEQYNYLLTVYVGERLLYRLSQSPYQQQYILKGATLFKVWNGEPHRATKDLDFLSFGNNEVEHIEKVFEEICLRGCLIAKRGVSHKVLNKTNNLQKSNPPAPLPYISAACRRLGRGVSKPLSASGRGLERG